VMCGGCDVCDVCDVCVCVCVCVCGPRADGITWAVCSLW